jgi:hypothetical protein
VVLCGREDEVRRIVEDCRQDRFVVVVAEPGLGATSLLAEGVAPALRADGFITVVFDDWQGRAFVANLKEAIARAVRAQADEQFFAEPEMLDETLYRTGRQTGHRVALLLDRFEDYLRGHSGTDLSDAFDAELADAIARHHGVFVVAIHQHAVKSFERLSQLIPNLLGYRVVLPPLSPEAAKEMVSCMAEERGCTVEPEVAAALTAAPAAAFDGGVHPYFLARGTTRLLEAEIRSSSTVARMSTLEAHGGAERLILESCDAQFSELIKPHRELFLRWCNILVSPEGQALSVTEKALTEYSGKLDRFIPALLPILLERGLIRTFEMPGAKRYELPHQSLAPIVRDWRTRREAALAVRRKVLFRISSVSVAVGGIVALYAAWVLITWKK